MQRGSREAPAGMAPPSVGRKDVLSFRFRQHQLDREPGSAAGPSDVAVVRHGVQDTGHDGAPWALALRGVAAPGWDDLALAWTLRGAPHAYLRGDLPAVAVATAPLSEADAAKRVYDAATPLRATGIPVLEALRVVADHLRDIVAAPTVKGEVSRRLTEVLDPPYLRWCRPCGATHAYEMPFRLAALQAGLELEPGTSPPVLRRVPGLPPPRLSVLAGSAHADVDVVRGHLRAHGPARVADVAAWLDAPVKDVERHWPDDVVPVTVADAAGTGRRHARYVLADDLDSLVGGPGAAARTVRLVAPHDPYLALRDRELLVPDEGRRKDLWRVLGRPGAVVADGEVLATWRARATGPALRVSVEPFGRMPARDRPLVAEQAERLAAHRGLRLGGVEGI